MSETLNPENENQLLEIIKSTLADNTSISIAGQNTKYGFGHSHAAQNNIRMTSFDGIVEYDPAELVMRAKAGTPMSTIENALSEHRQHLAFEPPNLGKLYEANSSKGTIGGAFVGNLSGPRRFVAGAARDHILGVKAVSGRGEVFKSGGNVIKNVTGYDMSKLITNSWGTLSIITELSFKVLPAPALSITLGITNISPDSAMHLLSKLAQSALQISGLAYIPGHTLSNSDSDSLSPDYQTLCLIRIEGSQLSVKDRVAGIESLIGGIETLVHFNEEDSKSLWKLIRDPDEFMSAHKDTTIIKVSIPPAHASTLIELLSSIEDCDWYADAAGAWFWISLKQDVVAKILLLRNSLIEIGGSAIIYKASETVKKEAGIFSQMDNGLQKLNQGIKNSFDPNNILNPNRLFISI
jgi:glycolate oxidase FAD binding subunit